MTAPLETIRAQYRRLSEADQLALMVDLIQSHRELNRTDAFIDALAPVDEAFDAAFNRLADAALPECVGGFDRMGLNPIYAASLGVLA